MPAHVPSLLVALALGVAAATVAVSAIGRRGRARRGFAFWVAANGLLAAGLVLAAATDAASVAVPAASLLVLQWPIVTLIGVRRFYARGSTGIPAWVDGAAFAAAALATAGAWAAPFDAAPPPVVFAGAALLLTGYLAIAVRRLDDYATTSTLRVFVGAAGLAAAGEAAWLAGIVSFPGEIAGHAALGAPFAYAGLAIAMTQLSLVMNHERQLAHLRASQRKLKQLVDVDALTGLPNRRHFTELAGRAVEVQPELATVVVFDIDRLRRINELVGHSSGDEALRQVGTVLRQTLRRRDVAGRIGGDEFAAVLPRTKVADAQVVISRVNASIGDRQVAPRLARLSLNAGTTQMRAGETVADALRRAELALQAARDEARRDETSSQASTVAESPAGSEHSTVSSPATLGPATTSPGRLSTSSTPLMNNLAPRPSQAAALNAIPVGEVID